MKQVLLALATTALMAATSVHAQEAQPATAQPQATAATAAAQVSQTCHDAQGRQIPCPPQVQKVAANHTPIILGAVGAAALIGAAAGGGGSDNPAPPPKPSSP
jgi:ABC-type Fe3+-hydroxamate transport system substrate-binding protein